MRLKGGNDDISHILDTQFATAVDHKEKDKNKLIRNKGNNLNNRHFVKRKKENRENLLVECRSLEGAADFGQVKYNSSFESVDIGKYNTGRSGRLGERKYTPYLKEELINKGHYPHLAKNSGYSSNRLNSSGKSSNQNQRKSYYNSRQGRTFQDVEFSHEMKNLSEIFQKPNFSTYSIYVLYI